MARREEFQLVGHDGALLPDYTALLSGKLVDADSQVQAMVRDRFPDKIMTAVPSSNIPLLQYAALGHASAQLDTEADTVLGWRGYVPPTSRHGNGHLGDAVFFARYSYQWKTHDFVLFIAGPGSSQIQYLLADPVGKESPSSKSAATDSLLLAAVKVLQGNTSEFVYVFDNYWVKSKDLWYEVQKSSWDKVILDPAMKKSLQDVSSSFFDSKDLYDQLGVPWKRGLIFAGPPGNGKTISLKALMKTLYDRDDPIPTLYVKTAPQTYHLAAVFAKARQMSPCLLVMEDIETIVTSITRSYFFNEVDGLANNAGILMVASTNYLDKLDPGLSKRPSRFDRKFIFPLPDNNERTLYAQFWRSKLAKAHSPVEFPDKLCPAMASITDGFSFAYLQEAFVATMLAIARESTDASPELGSGATRVLLDDDDDDDLKQYKLWRVFQHQVTILRDNMSSDPSSNLSANSADLPDLSTTAVPFKEQPRAEQEMFASSWRTGVPVRTVMDNGSAESSLGASNSLEPPLGLYKQQVIGQQAFEWQFY